MDSSCASQSVSTSTCCEVGQRKSSSGSAASANSQEVSIQGFLAIGVAEGKKWTAPSPWTPWALATATLQSVGVQGQAQLPARQATEQQRQPHHELALGEGIPGVCLQQGQPELAQFSAQASQAVELFPACAPPPLAMQHQAGQQTSANLSQFALPYCASESEKPLPQAPPVKPPPPTGPRDHRPSLAQAQEVPPPPPDTTDGQWTVPPPAPERSASIARRTSNADSPTASQQDAAECAQRLAEAFEDEEATEEEDEVLSLHKHARIGGHSPA